MRSRGRKEFWASCPLVKFLLRYLGLQLVLCPLTRSQWQLVVEKVIDFLPAWQCGLIAREGRILLIKALVVASLFINTWSLRP
jgi:hypothetical protein